MKLQELITEKIDLSTSTPIDFRGNQWLPISGDMAGEGIQARVYNTGRGIVTKIAVLDEEKGLSDNAVKFLDIILKHQDNPFFPKIYHARVYRDKEGIMDPILLVQMEKLLPIIGKGSDKIADVIPHLFNQLKIPTDNISDSFKRSLEMIPKHHRAVSAVTHSFLKTFRGSSPEQFLKFVADSKNPQFVEAMKILVPAMKRLGSDLHAGNWMVRLTGTGPQLVITDPFVSDSDANFSDE